ncbi:MAG TPA: WG repeat-containing protein, partial [Ignavibacteria bacterium]
MKSNYSKQIIIFILIFFLFDIQNIAAQIDSSSQLSDLIPYRSGDKWGFCDKNKRIIIPVKYDDVRNFREELAPVKLNDKWGFVNKESMEIIPPKYENVWAFSEGLASVN